MAYIYQLDSGLWRAQIAKKGHPRESKTFATKTAARTWATSREAEIDGTRRGAVVRKTVADALDRYALEVSPTKKGARLELLRLAAFKREKWAQKWLKDIDAPDFSAWRDERLQAVTKGSVQRDFNLIKAVMNRARKEWRWLTHDPMLGVVMPGDNEPRTRRVLPSEVRKMCRALGYAGGNRIDTKMQELAFAFLVGLHTAMRQGEILRLTAEDIDLARRTIHIAEQKNGKKQDIPITKPAARLLAKRLEAVKEGALFTITSASADALWRKCRERAGIEGLNFHDSRAECLTRLASVRRVDVMTLVRISRHSDITILIESYYREGGASIAQRL